jgi:hypothetical protein
LDVGTPSAAQNAATDCPPAENRASRSAHRAAAESDGEWEDGTGQDGSGEVGSDTAAPSRKGTDANHRTPGVNYVIRRAGTVLANYTYVYDAADRLEAKVENGTGTSYSYDTASQLTQDGAATFGFDATGNRTNAGYATGTGTGTPIQTCASTPSTRGKSRMR